MAFLNVIVLLEICLHLLPSRSQVHLHSRAIPPNTIALHSPPNRRLDQFSSPEPDAVYVIKFHPQSDLPFGIPDLASLVQTHLPSSTRLTVAPRTYVAPLSHATAQYLLSLNVLEVLTPLLPEDKTRLSFDFEENDERENVKGGVEKDGEETEEHRDRRDRRELQNDFVTFEFIVTILLETDAAWTRETRASMEEDSSSFSEEEEEGQTRRSRRLLFLSDFRSEFVRGWRKTKAFAEPPPALRLRWQNEMMMIPPSSFPSSSTICKLVLSIDASSSTPRLHHLTLKMVVHTLTHHVPLRVLFVHPSLPRIPLNFDANRQLQQEIFSDGSGGFVGSETPFWDTGLTGTNMIVTVMDTGLHASHCQFYDASFGLPVPRNVNFTSSSPHRKLVHIEQVSGDDCDGSLCVGDFNGHGTHVAGTIAGKSGSSPSFDGIAKDAKLYVQTFRNTDILPALRRAYAAGSRIHSNSWGCGMSYFACEWDCNCTWKATNPFGKTPGAEVEPSYCMDSCGTLRCCECCNSYSGAAADVDGFLENNDEMVVVFAAGNNGAFSEFATVIAPGTAKSCITVGATQSRNSHWTSSANYDDFFHYYTEYGWDSPSVAANYPEACCSPSEPEERKRRCCPSYKVSHVYNDTMYYSDTTLAYFSSRGPNRDGRISPDVVAPGYRTLSARSNCIVHRDHLGFAAWYNRWDAVTYCNDEDPTEDQLTGGFVLKQGTSMATPAVSGLLALMRQYFVEGWFPTQTKRTEDEWPTISGALLKSVLVNSADPTFHKRVLLGNWTLVDLENYAARGGSANLSSTVGAAVPGLLNQFVGFGIPRAYRTLFPNRSRNEMFLVEDRIRVHQDEIVRTHCFRVEEEWSDLRATISYYDKAPAPMALTTLINQVNLMALRISPSSPTTNVTHWGNGGSVPDPLNPTEKIVLRDLSKGDYVCLYLYGTAVDVLGQKVPIAINTANLTLGCPPFWPNLNCEDGSNPNCRRLRPCDRVFGAYGPLNDSFRCLDGVDPFPYGLSCSGHGKCASVGALCECDVWWGISQTNCSEHRCSDGYLVSHNNSCLGRGTCVSGGDDCTCMAGYYGSHCQSWNCSTLSECSGNGTCAAPQNCVCWNTSRYTGSNCSIPVCRQIVKGQAGECNLRGDCLAHDYCECTAPHLWGGRDCELWKCNGVAYINDLVCAGHGTCYSNHSCVCGGSHYTGSNCNETSCAGLPSTHSLVCRSRGSCLVRNNCTCWNRTLWGGTDCEIGRCSGIDWRDSEFVCSGRGSCNNESHVCSCDSEEFGGPNCGYLRCGGISEFAAFVCGSHGSCVLSDDPDDGRETKCSCDVGWEGDDCSEKKDNENAAALFAAKVVLVALVVLVVVGVVVAITAVFVVDFIVKAKRKRVQHKQEGRSREAQ